MGMAQDVAHYVDIMTEQQKLRTICFIANMTNDKIGLKAELERLLREVV